LHFDLIICNKAFDETTCIAHFINELNFYNWIFSLMNHKKKTLLLIFKNLINQCDRIRFDERAIIRIIRIDQKIFIDKKFEDWMREQKINWDWSTKNIFEQNEKFERFDDMLIEKAKCIKEHVKLSEDFYSECYLVVAHILNRTSSSSLSWNSSLIFMQKLLKESIRNEIVHFQMFDCKAFSLLKETDAFKKNERMKSRAFIEYLIEYDFINIFRVWNSKKDDVNDYRDVIFNETKFFDTYEKVDLFKKEERKFYVTYRAIFMQIFENSDEKQYDKISIRKFVLNNFRKNVVSKSMMKKKSHHQKNFNCLRLTIHHRLNQSRLAILLQSRYRDFFFEKKLQTKKWLIFLEKINHWTKKIIFLFERKVFFVQTHRSYRMSFLKLKMFHWTCWHRKISAFE
jgi:hypothetical protein